VVALPAKRAGQGIVQISKPGAAFAHRDSEQHCDSEEPCDSEQYRGWERQSYYMKRGKAAIDLTERSHQRGMPEESGENGGMVTTTGLVALSSFRPSRFPVRRTSGPLSCNDGL
jgi:hypothetical protein